jgi:hypothetical protein
MSFLAKRYGWDYGKSLDDQPAETGSFCLQKVLVLGTLYTSFPYFLLQRLLNLGQKHLVSVLLSALHFSHHKL